MAFTTSGVITDKGRDLLAKAQSGAAIQFLRIELGEGDVGTGSQVSLTALKKKVLSLTISGFSPVKSGTVTVQAQLKPQDIPKDFWWREVGVIARDPDLGDILYAYCSAGDKADFIPKAGVDNMVVMVPLVVGAAANVTAVLDLAQSYVTNQAFTASNLITMIKTVDGSGSGLDGDTVDGLHGADLAKAADLTALDSKVKEHAHNGTDAPKVAYANITGTPGSLPANGGNADTVDGLHGADLAKAADLTTLNTTLSNQVKAHTHNGTDAPKVAYANVTGTPTSLPANGGNAATVGGLSPADLVKVADYTAARVLEMLKTVDGNASGLDADMVHGMPGNEMMRMGLGKPFISAGADLDWVQNPGSYTASDDSLVKTLINRPCDSSFQLDIWWPLNDHSYVVQRATTFTSRVFYRYGHIHSGWQPWREVMMQ